MNFNIFYRDLLKEFYFPETLDGRFTMDLYGRESDYLKKDLQFTLYVSSGVWRLAASKAWVAGGKPGIDLILSKDSLVEVTVPDAQDKIKILPLKSDPGLYKFTKYYVSGAAGNRIAIGRGRKNEIVYNNDSAAETMAVITRTNGETHIEPQPQSAVYLNGRLIGGKTRVRFGDCVHLRGLKIVHLGMVLAVNNPFNSVLSSLKDYNDISRTATMAKEPEKKAVTVEALFSRAPRITSPLETEKMEIEAPPNRAAENQMPLMLTVGPSANMGLAMIVSLSVTIAAGSSSGGMSSIVSSASTTVVMLLGAILWPALMNRYQKNESAKTEQKRHDRYMSYIANLDTVLAKMNENNRSVLVELYPPLEKCFSRCFNSERELWERSPQYDDFLDVRIGMGSRPALMQIVTPKDRFALEDDELRNEPQNLAKKHLQIPNTPVSVNLKKNFLLGIIGAESRVEELAKTLIVHLTALHSYDELKFCMICKENRKEVWEFTKWLPHSFTKNRKLRLMVYGSDYKHAVFEHLEIEAQSRLARKKNVPVFIPHYVIFIEDMAVVDNERAIKFLIDSGKDLGFSIVFLSTRIDMLPYSCQVIIQQTDKSETYYYDRNDKSGMMKPVLPDVVTDSLERYSKKLFRTRILEQSESAGIPTMLTFLELYRAGRVEDLVISKRWAQSQPQSSLEAPLGITEGGEVFSLDIHESFHGPHGLIAGTTGSGKSEFIQSYILSMAINFHPYDVSFILIDYKGGGMANCFRGLPHVAGTITNLGGNMIHRSLVSLRSEMDRRQAIFAANDVNHIDKYQKLYKEKKVTIPLPHLVIISDEFAELKEQQHEFMKELVSAARIGRSLGVHLILATQKPSSSVSDEIRSNTRFRACLKVNTTEDSKDMLKRPEAAEITLPGRGYVQVGNDELFKLVQSGWSGAPYVPSEKYEPADVQSVSLLSANGLAAHVAKPEKPSGKGAKSQLDTIVQFINDYSERMSITPLRMWLDPMPAIMSWSALKKPAGGFDGHKWTPYPEWLNPTIGQYDDPPAQFQGPLSMNIGANGHVAIFGAPTTGKTTFVQTLIYSLVMNHSPEDLNMYLLDFGGRILGNFQALPHVGDVVFSDDEGKLNKLFKLLSDELAERKKLFGSRGVASLQSYRETTGKKLPAILFILDNYAAFNETYPDAETNIITLSREGANCGIYLVLTASASSVIKFKVIQNFKLMYALNLNDKYDYTNVVGQTGGMEPDALKGRGLAKVGRPVEFQIALAEGIEGDAERSAKLKEIFAQMDNSWTGERAKSIPIVPEDLTMPSLLLRADFVSAAKSALIPIAYDIEEAKLITITPRAQTFFNVMGLDGSGKTTFLKSIVEYVNEKHGWPVHVVDSADGAWQDMASSVDSYADSVESLETLMKKVLNRLLSRRQQVKALAGDQAALKTLAESFTPEIVIIDDFPQFYTLLNDVSMNCLENIIKGAGGLGGLFFVAADGENLNSFVGEKIYPHVFSGKLGIQLGGRFTLQNVYKQNLPFDLQSIDCQPGQGFYLNGNNYNLIKTFRP